jgi:hypothetical protein
VRIGHQFQFSFFGSSTQDFRVFPQGAIRIGKNQMTPTIGFVGLASCGTAPQPANGKRHSHLVQILNAAFRRRGGYTSTRIVWKASSAAIFLFLFRNQNTRGLAAFRQSDERHLRRLRPAMLVGQRKYVQFQYVQFSCSAVEWAVARADLRLGTETLISQHLRMADRAGLLGRFARGSVQHGF